jgi:hypothetical protein
MIVDTAGAYTNADFSLQMNTYYPFTILDNTTNVVLYFNGQTTPILTLNTTNKSGNLLGMQNREGACCGSTISAGSITKLAYINVTTTPTAPFLTNGLIAYYPFNGNANDATTNGNNGTPYNITYVADRFGNHYSAASFAGNSTSYIVIGTTNFNLTTLSISVWINPTAALGIEGPRIFSTAGYEITSDSPVNNLGLSPRFIEFMNLTSAQFQAGVWTHIVATLSPSEEAIYLDGNLSASVTNSQPPNFSNGWLPTIGVNSGNYNNDNYGGVIDDLAIYNRVLSPMEVAEIYQSSLLAGITTVPGIMITGNTNQNYSVQYITNISSTNWTTLTTLLLTTNCVLYCDTNALGETQRFYRVVAQ